jgi:hypothetical protein
MHLNVHVAGQTHVGEFLREGGSVHLPPSTGRRQCPPASFTASFYGKEAVSTARRQCPRRQCPPPRPAPRCPVPRSAASFSGTARGRSSCLDGTAQCDTMTDHDLWLADLQIQPQAGERRRWRSKRGAFRERSLEELSEEGASRSFQRKEPLGASLKAVSYIHRASLQAPSFSLAPLPSSGFHIFSPPACEDVGRPPSRA